MNRETFRRTGTGAACSRHDHAAVAAQDGDNRTDAFRRCGPGTGYGRMDEFPVGNSLVAFWEHIVPEVRPAKILIRDPCRKNGVSPENSLPPLPEGDCFFILCRNACFHTRHDGTILGVMKATTSSAS